MTSTKNLPKKNNSGMALFMVMSSLALLAVLLAELTYNTQVHSRLSYNSIDSIRSYYLSKAGFRLGLLRLKVYFRINEFLGEAKNQQIKAAVPMQIIEQIWKMPIIFPIKLPDGVDASLKGALDEFNRKTNLKGQFNLSITAEGNKFNINQIFIKTAPPLPEEPTTNQTNTARNANNGQPANTRPPANGAQPTQANTEPQPVKFRELLEPLLDSALKARIESDEIFAQAYRNVTGRDLVDAIYTYIDRMAPHPNLPGYTRYDAKEAPFYSLTELRLIPGIDDSLYEVLESVLTVFSPPGLNVNSLSESTLRALIPELNEEEAGLIIKRRDDPEAGKPFANEAAFWDAFKDTRASGQVPNIKLRLKEARIKLVTSETLFRIVTQATVGQSVKTMVSYVTRETTSQALTPNAPNNANGAPNNPNQPANPNAQQPNQTAAQPANNLQVIYSRIL